MTRQPRGRDTAHLLADFGHQLPTLPTPAPRRGRPGCSRPPRAADPAGGDAAGRRRPRPCRSTG